ncbi:hypothetical protein [Nostoc sp. NMS4]|uniref:hypothetical protein n=1 Tax=Nostoc sp. NMS4 TaxID=2815390 RepID=UPI0025D54DFA|nr:hypothetical protein [Nostoc sp. NMS4]MBN3925599.1 hypothetical protein [Nostoc sp. NMS4]
MDITLPYIERLTGALEYVYRLRTWLGNGIDVEMWWKFPTGECYFFQSLTGETAEENPVPKICKKTGISVDKFDLMIKCLVDNGIMELESDTEHGIMTNHNEFYYVLLKDGSSNFFLAMCGHHRDSKFKNIVNILIENIK